ncbi:MAG TPA: sensor histidine kinase [Spirochaetota bacterium]|nr:sensor histidine kinase [Spirochaetota bacterium]
MKLIIILAGSLLLQLIAGIISFRYFVLLKVKMFWFLMTCSFFLLSFYSFSLLWDIEQISATYPEMFRAIILCGSSFLFSACLLVFGRRQAVAIKDEYSLVLHELRTALKEKDVLLKEVHHRVKNNLQVIASILDLSSLEVADRDCSGLFDDAVAKISTMAIIHSQLYQSERFDRINMEEHLNEMVFYLKNFYENGHQHRFEFFIENERYITLNQEVPATLILTELISNSLKHGFPGNGGGKISVYYSVDAQKSVLLRIKDTGIGFERDNEASEPETMGLLLVRNLVQDQLKGSITFINDGGTEVIISFPFEDVHEYTKDNGR